MPSKTELWTRLKSADKPIYIYGTGNGADKLIAELDRRGIKISGVFASDGFVRNRSFHGMPVLSRNQIDGDIIALVAFGSSRPDVIEYIRKIASGCELYAPELPVFGGGIFDLDYLDSRKSDAQLVRSRLCDERSRLTFDSIISYKITGDIAYLEQCQVSRDEPFESILRFGDGCVFADFGAYRGDTVAEFLCHAQNPRRIYAVEPDLRSFAKLKASFGDRAECINAAAAEHSGVGFMDGGRGRGSHVSRSGTPVMLIAADDLEIRPTYIKLDVEGAENAAIAGARKTISQYRPMLKIAAYHRTGDIFDIVKQVLEIRDDYRVFMRHHPCVPAWDTDYYFI